MDAWLEYAAGVKGHFGEFCDYSVQVTHVDYFSHSGADFLVWVSQTVRLLQKEPFECLNLRFSHPTTHTESGALYCDIPAVLTTTALHIELQNYRKYVPDKTD